MRGGRRVVDVAGDRLGVLHHRGQRPLQVVGGRVQLRDVLGVLGVVRLLLGDEQHAVHEARDVGRVVDHLLRLLVADGLLAEERVLLDLLLGRLDEVGRIGGLVAERPHAEHRVRVLLLQVVEVLLGRLAGRVVHADAAGRDELRREAVDLGGRAEQHFGDFLVAARTARGHHAARLRRAIAERLQIVRFLLEVLLSPGNALGHVDGVAELLQWRRDVHEIFDNTIDQSVLNLLFEFVKFCVQLSGDFLRFRCVAQPLCAKFRKLIGQIIDFIAQLQNLNFLVSRQAFSNFLPLVNNQIDGTFSDAFVVDARVLEPAAGLLEPPLHLCRARAKEEREAAGNKLRTDGLGR